MPNPVCYFEIPVSDLKRAMVFYSSVFGYTFEPTELDGNQMAFFPSSDLDRGISGALAQGESYIPGKQGSRIYFSTENMSATLNKAVQSGGRILYPRTSVGTLGFVAEFEDSEGNCIALHSMS